MRSNGRAFQGGRKAPGESEVGPNGALYETPSGRPRLIAVVVLLSLLPFIFLPASALADAASDAKLRETLRNTILQLRTAQNERAALQATQAENDAKLKKLTAEVESLRKEAAAANKTITDQQAQLAKFKEALQNWEAAYKQATDLATSKETARAKLADEAIALQRQVADQKTKNAALFRTANEILTRYERFGLGEALAAKEPFVGVTRVKLETLVQDYADKIADERIKDSETAKPGAQTKAPQSQSPGSEQASQKPKPGGG
jgi:hypothetical protein